MRESELSDRPQAMLDIKQKVSDKQKAPDGA